MNTQIKDDIVLEKKVAIKIKTPPLYNVILLNDDVTPFDYVEYILMNMFNKTKEQAMEIALKIHNEQKAIVAIYPKEIANTKKTTVEKHASRNGYPLRCESSPA